MEESDVRAMVRLVSEVIARPGDHADKKRHLLGGLCRLIAADWWVWGLGNSGAVAGEAHTCLSALEGAADQEHLTRLDRDRPARALARRDSCTFVELHRRQAHAVWSQAPGGPAECGSSLLQSETGLVPCILSRKQVSLNCGSAIGLYRSPGETAFSQREVRLADIVLTEVTWLHEQDSPAAAGRAITPLPRRQLQTLNLLIHGHSRNEIAERLRISVHTVGDYVKAIYDHFDVQSRAELIRRLRSGSPMEANL